MEILKTDAFDRWLRKLKDKKVKAIIQVHIDRLIEDKPGKIKSLGANVYEKKIVMARDIGYTWLDIVNRWSSCFAEETNQHNKMIFSRQKN